MICFNKHYFVNNRIRFVARRIFMEVARVNAILEHFSRWVYELWIYVSKMCPLNGFRMQYTFRQVNLDDDKWLSTALEFDL